MLSVAFIGVFAQVIRDLSSQKLEHDPVVYRLNLFPALSPGFFVCSFFFFKSDSMHIQSLTESYPSPAKKTVIASS